jgi:hypothetical protein
VQSPDNSVKLIAGKTTLIRVYLDSNSVAQPMNLRGELVIRTSQNGPASYIPGMNDIRLDPNSGLSLDEQRTDFRQSLNFRLPTEAVTEGKRLIQLNKLVQTGGEDQPFSGGSSLEAEFIFGPPIRVRCIGLRYRNRATGKAFSPDAVHFKYFRSFLRRAYPVSDVLWSQIVVDADFSAPFDKLTPTLSNAQVAAIRNSEINSGTDPRTHYYGLVDDGNRMHFMRGLASGIPESPQPDTVASGPCGVGRGLAGDFDLSYADWYGAHELGHTFGRYHPGFPPSDQDRSDIAFPYDDGRIADANHPFIGYDMGDAELGIEMQLLAGFDHHDIMTYADKQWVSASAFGFRGYAICPLEM